MGAEAGLTRYPGRGRIEVSSNRGIRLAVRLLAAGIFSWAILADPTRAGHGATTGSTAFFWYVFDDLELAQTVSFFINSYTILAIFLFLGSYLTMDRPKTLTVYCGVLLLVLVAPSLLGPLFSRDQRREAHSADLKALLLNLGEAQDRHFRESGSFTTELGGLRVEVRAGIDLRIDLANATEWHAVANGPFSLTCEHAGRAPGPGPERATREGPTCD